MRPEAHSGAGASEAVRFRVRSPRETASAHDAQLPRIEAKRGAGRRALRRHS